MSLALFWFILEFNKSEIIEKQEPNSKCGAPNDFGSFSGRPASSTGNHKSQKGVRVRMWPFFVEEILGTISDWKCDKNTCNTYFLSTKCMIPTNFALINS